MKRLLLHLETMFYILTKLKKNHIEENKLLLQSQKFFKKNKCQTFDAFDVFKMPFRFQIASKRKF